MKANPDTMLIEWKSDRGLEKTESRIADLAVFADGRVVVGPRFANGTVTEHLLSEADLVALRRFVFEEQDIWSIDSAALERAVKASSGSSTDSGPRAAQVLPPENQVIADAATTVIRVDDGERQHEVSHYNLVGNAQRNPKIDELQRLRAIELRLLHLAQKIASSPH